MDRREAMEEIGFIKQLMEDSRRVVVYDGRGFITWGILVALGLVTSYTLIVQRMNMLHVWVWSGIVVAGWLWSYVDRRRLRAESRAETFAGRVLWAVWFACGIAMTLTGGAAFAFGVVSLYALPSMTAFILGVGYYVTGRLMDVSWVRLLALCWWLGGAALLLVRTEVVLLLYAGMMVAFQVIPGILLQRRLYREAMGGVR